MRSKETEPDAIPTTQVNDRTGRAILPWLLACAGFVAFMIALLMPLFLKKTEPLWDAISWYYPMFNYTVDSLKEGRFPLWDPYTNCGLPFHADPQSLTLNPVAMFFGGLIQDSAIGFIAFWAFHWILGGVGMIWLVRHFNGKPMGGLFAAATYALSGFFIGHAEHTSIVQVAGWLPWIIWFADRAVLTSNLGWALLGGFSLGMASYGGYIPFPGLAVAIWLGSRFLTGWDADGTAVPSLRQRSVRIISTLAIIATVSLLVWSPVLNAFFTEGTAYTDRVNGLPPEVAKYINTFTLPALFSLLFPYSSYAGVQYMQADPSGTNGYVGILTIPIAALWWWGERKRRRHWWILFYILFMFLGTLGAKAGVATLLYYIYPPAQFNRHLAPGRLYWILPVTLMAGLGFSFLKDYLKKFRIVRLVFTGWSAIVLIVAGSLIYFFVHHGAVVDRSFYRLFVPAMVVLPLFLIIIWYENKKTGSPLQSRMLYILVLCLVCVDMGWHLYNNAGTVWLQTDYARQAEALRQRRTLVLGDPGPRYKPYEFGLFNVHQVMKKPIVKAYVPMSTTGFDEVLVNSRFATVLQSSPRFWISRGTEQTPDQAMALSVLSATGVGDPVPAFVEHRIDDLPQARTVPGSYGKVRVLLYAPENILMEVEVPSGRGGFLASTERYTPGWKASIDGTPCDVIKTNLYFRGIAVSSGQHRIVWKYEPARWLASVRVSFFALLGSFVAGIVLVHHRHKWR
jgi:hypothetical protein